MKSDEINNLQIGHRILLARHDKQMSQRNLADQANLSPSYIGSIERGRKRCSPEALCRICTALEISADYILFGKCTEQDEIAIVCDYLERHLNDLRLTLSDPHFLK